jgi:hypothetical protein
MNGQLEAVFRPWETWDMETDESAKDALRVALFAEIYGLVVQLGLTGEGGLPMTPREFMQNARGHYRNWRRRAH